MAARSLDELVETALTLARQRQQGVADIPLTSLAAAAGISRSTLLRQLGGTRRTLDDAVRAVGLDPGGRQPVRERAVVAAARLMSERGLAGVTLDAVAAAAGCSLPSLHTVFEGRDGLLAAVFGTHYPLHDLERILADPPADTAAAIRCIIEALLKTFTTEPGILRAVVADYSGRPGSPARRVLGDRLSALLDRLSAWLTGQQRAGRFRELPLPLLIELLIGPVSLYLLSWQSADPDSGDILASHRVACDTFADAFLRAVAMPG